MKKKNVMISLSSGIIEKAKRVAKKDNRSMSGLIESLILNISEGPCVFCGDLSNWNMLPKEIPLKNNNSFSGDLNLTPEEIFNFKILAVKLWNDPFFKKYMWGFTQKKINEIINTIKI